MNAPIHAGGEEDFQALEDTRQDVRRWRFYCLVKHLCRKKGPFAWWRVHRAWRRICRRYDKSRALWWSAHGLVALVGFALVCSLLGACRERPPESARPVPQQQDPTLPEDSKVAVSGTWPPTGYQRVVAHRFKIPEGNLESFSLLEGGKVDLALLKTLSAASAELTPDQTTTLLAGVFHDRKTPMAACYEPHHLFLFLDGEGKVRNAIEICFSCTNVHALPELSQKQWARHDFRLLARLCDEAGIGLGGAENAEDFIKILDDRERE